LKKKTLIIKREIKIKSELCKYDTKSFLLIRLKLRQTKSRGSNGKRELNYSRKKRIGFIFYGEEEENGLI
jgi:hypothetical protein